MLKLDKKVKSKIDNTIKYIYKLDGKVVEFSYIDNNSGKDIICVPCQTMCNMKCTFCHLTDHIGKIKVTDINYRYIADGVMEIIDDLNLASRSILISYMGCGEPLLNFKNIVDSMIILGGEYDDIRFGLATMLPKSKWGEFMEMTKRVSDLKLPLKLHLSLHFTNDELRSEWMPAALDIKSSLAALHFYNKVTGNPIEVHYTIMDNINDNFDYATNLELLLRHMNCTIKFMRYSEKESLDVKRASMEKLGEIMTYLEECGFDVEYYEPPGDDIGASCGQFLMEDNREKYEEA